MDSFKYGGTNFTAFRMIDVDKPEVQAVIYSIVESMVDKEMVEPLPDGNLDTTTALIYDSVTAFAIALHDLSLVQQVTARARIYQPLLSIKPKLNMKPEVSLNPNNPN